MGSVLRSPVVFGKWVLVVLGVLAWLVIVPLLEIARGGFELLRRKGDRRAPADRGPDTDAT